MKKPFKRQFSCILPLMIFGSLTSPAFAGEDTSPLNSLYDCAAITDNPQRLACFDENVRMIRGKEEKKEIVAIDSEGVKAIKRDSFGFSLPSLPKLGILKDKKSKASKTALTFKVKSISKGSRKTVIAMENGHVWQQTSGDLGYIPKGDLTATIKPASLGSYFISLSNEKGQSGRKGARVKRIK